MVKTQFRNMFTNQPLKVKPQLSKFRRKLFFIQIID